jgi:hypothetical protein
MVAELSSSFSGEILLARADYEDPRMKTSTPASYSGSTGFDSRLDEQLS